MKPQAASGPLSRTTTELALQCVVNAEPRLSKSDLALVYFIVFKYTLVYNRALRSNRRPGMT